MLLLQKRGVTFLSAEKELFVAVRIFATLANTKCIFSLFKNESLIRFLTTLQRFGALFATTDFGVTVWGAHICYPGQYEMHFSILSKSAYESELLAGVALWEHFCGREMGDGRFQGVFPLSTLNPKRLEVYVEEVC